MSRRRAAAGEAVTVEILCGLSEMRALGDDTGAELQLSLAGEGVVYRESETGARKKLSSFDTAAVSLESADQARSVAYARPVDRARPVHVFVIKAAKEDVNFVCTLVRSMKTARVFISFEPAEFERAAEPAGLSWIVEGEQ